MNIIGKQYVDISFHGATDPFAFRDEVSQMCRTKLLPAIEKVLDERSPMDRIYYFEKLQVDVGDLPKENWDSLFVEKVIDQLLRHVSGTSSFSFPSTSSDFFSPTHVFTGDEIVKNEKQGNVMVEIQEGQNSKQTIFYFLKTGLLPWNTSIKNRQELNEALAKLIDNKNAFVELLQLALSHDHILQRLVQQFNIDLLDKIILKSSNISNAVLTDLKTSLAALVKLTGSSSRREQQIMYEAMLASASRHISKSEAAFISSAIEGVFTMITLKPFIQALILRNDCTYEIFMEAFTRKIDQVISAENIRHQVKSYLIKEITETKIADSLKDESRMDNKSKPARKVASADISIDEVYVNNAGLVLLHPFLHLLFENVGYTENKVWLTDETQERAIALTQYMVTGMELVSEFDLILNKILVGYPSEKTLPVEMILSDFEKQEADDVLNSAIRHWPALKNTSIDGLRSAFLKRDGKLYKDDSGWNLKVDQKTQDILLNRLPWGLSIVKTPWMKTMMKVEWA